jgi:chromosome partitioning protein
MTNIITIANQKGGVGKTTTAINVASFLATAGKRVLLVDLDGQANASSGLGFRLDENEYSTYSLLSIKGLTVQDVIRKTDFNIDIIPSQINLSAIEFELMNRIGRESVLKTKLKPIISNYDFIIIDTPPSLSMLTINSLVASTGVYITVESNPLALDGLNKLFDTINLIREDLNSDISIGGIIITMFDSRTKLGQSVVDKLKTDDKTKDIVFNTVIRRNVKLAEAIDSGKPINFYDKDCNGYADYKALTDEILMKY